MKNFKSFMALFATMTAFAAAPSTVPATPPTTPPIENPAPLTLTPKPPVIPPQTQELPSFDDAQNASESLTYENMFIKTVLALVGLLLLVFFALWVLRKLSGSRTRQMNMLKTVKVLEKRPISPKSILYLVEVAGRKVLISESQLEARTICQLDWIDTPPTDS